MYYESPTPRKEGLGELARGSFVAQRGDATGIVCAGVLYAPHAVRDNISLSQYGARINHRAYGPVQAARRVLQDCRDRGVGRVCAVVNEKTIIVTRWPDRRCGPEGRVSGRNEARRWEGIERLGSESTANIGDRISARARYVRCRGGFRWVSVRRRLHALFCAVNI